MDDYKTINDWHLTGAHAFRDAMKELGDVFRTLSTTHLHDLEAKVGRTLGVMARMFRSAPIPDEPTTWASQITASLNEEGLLFIDITRRWVMFYLEDRGKCYDPVPLPRGLEVIFKLSPTALSLCAQARCVYQAGLAMAVLSKNELYFRYYASKKLRLEEEIQKKNENPTYEDKRLFAVAHMNSAIAEATEGQWLCALDYLRKAETLHMARIGPLPAARQRPEMMSTRQDLFEVYYHTALITTHLAEQKRPGDPYDKAYWLYEDAQKAHDLAWKRLEPRPLNMQRRLLQLDFVRCQMHLSRALSMGPPRPPTYLYTPADSSEDIKNSYSICSLAWAICEPALGSNHHWTMLWDYKHTWLSIMTPRSHKAFEPVIPKKPNLEQLVERLDASPIYKRDYARATFLHARSLKAVGRQSDATSWLNRSVQVYNSLRPKDQRDAASLSWKDINSLVAYEYLDSLDEEYGLYNNDGYMLEWLEPESDSAGCV